MRKLYRSRYNKKFGGVCAGIGLYFKIDPNLVRLMTIFITVLTAFLPVLIIYIVLALIIPQQPAHAPALDYKHLCRDSRHRMFSGVCAGFAKFFNIEPTLMRLFFLLIALVSGLAPMIITYIAASMLLPNK